MADFADGAVAEQDFHDVEPDFHLGILQKPQVIEGALRKEPFFSRIHRGGGPGPILGGPRFHLYKNEAIVVAKDEIDFSPARAKICGQEFQPESLQMLFGGALAQITSAEVFRRRVALTPRLNSLPKVHR